MKFTFIITNKDEEKLKEKIESLNTINNKEIIILSSNDKNNIYENDKNIKYIYCDLNNLGKCYNKALKEASGDYINFSFTTDIITENTLKDVEKVSIKNHNEIIALKYNSYNNFSKKEGKLITNKIILSKEYTTKELYLSSYFIPKIIYKSLKFIENNPYNYGINYIIEAVIKNFGLTLLTNRYCYYLEPPIFSLESPLIQDEKWYANDIKNYILPLLEKYSYYYVKSIALNLLLMKLKANTNSVIKHQFNDNELKLFFKIFKKALQKIDDEIILGSANLKKEQKRIILFLKHNIAKDQKIELSPEGSIIFNNLVIERAINFPITICAINRIKNKIVFDAEYNAKILIINGGKINCYFNNKKIEIKENNVYSSTKIWNKVFNTKYTFSFEIPEKEISDNSLLNFEYQYKNNKYDLELNFNDDMPQAHLTTLFPHSYWNYKKNAIMTFENNRIIFKKAGLFKRVNQELGLYYDFLFKSKKQSLGIEALILRIIYRLTRPFYKNKRIWVTFDKLYKGGDNGEYFYQYMLNQKSKIKCYYIINKEAYDYKRLKHQKYILKFKSLKEYLTVLNAECIFATHAKVFNMCSFTKGKEKYFRDLFNQEIFCLQHGLTIQDIAHIQNRIYDNTKLYFCASKNEINNLRQKAYDYERFNYIKETGLARYDGLKNNDQKVILITPTWRANMANTKTIIGNIRPYYSEFKNTIYFKIYNDLINNPQLIASAKSYGYKIIYLVHPTLSSQVKDFDTNEYVKIYSVTEDQSYEKLLTTSSLMVTDYSGIQYDFAYMRKPILYYHPKELPPHYGNGGINYETEGFGPIYYEQEELVNSLINYMSNNCQTEEKYIKRANKFFIFNDYENCQRIYKIAKKYMEDLYEK